MESSQLKYPQIRENLKYYTAELASDNIEELWSNSENTGNLSENIEYIIHFFFDDTSFSTDVSAYIGLALNNDSEAKAVRELVDGLNSLFDTYGTGLSDKDYISKPEWQEIKRRAVDLMRFLEE